MARPKRIGVGAWRALLCLLCVLLGMSLISPAASAAPTPAFPDTPVSFPDVPVSQPFHDEITWLAARGITTGNVQPDGSRLYLPLAPVSRDAMAAFLYRLAGEPEFTPPATSSFADVPTSRVFYKEISWLAASGISTGWLQPDGTRQFRPGDRVARDAVAAFMYRFAGSPAHVVATVPEFTDVPVNHPFAKEISWLATQGVTTGWLQPDGTRLFRPSAYVARDAMAAFMYRLVGRIGTLGWTSEAIPLPTDSSFTDPAARFDGVDCPVGEVCFAIGSYRDSLQTEQLLIGQRTGGGWSVQGMAVPGVAPGDYVVARSLQCPTRDSCAGVVRTAAGSWILRLSGGVWGLTAVPGGASVWGTSCVDATTCYFLGTDPSGDGNQLVQLTDGQLQSRTLPLPSDARASAPWPGLSGLSCPAVDRCVITGDYYTQASQRWGRVVVVVGQATIALKAPALPDATGGPENNNYLGNVVCPSRTRCLVTGGYTDADNFAALSVGELTPAGLTLQRAALPTDAVGSTPADHDSSMAFTDLECRNETYCAAVGFYSAAGSKPLVQIWSAGGWQQSLGEVPAGLDNAELSAVDCGAEACIAVGGGSDQAGDSIPFSSTVAAVASPSLPLPHTGDGWDTFGPISCTERGLCVSGGARVWTRDWRLS